MHTIISAIIWICYEPGEGTNLAEGAGKVVMEEALDIIEQIKHSK